MATIKGTTGNDTLVGTTDADTINISQGGEDAVTALDGDDNFTVKGTFDAGDSLDGGVGNDKICLNGDYSAGVTFTATTITSIETIQLTAGNDYSLTTNDANVAGGARLTIDGSRLGAANHFTFDGSAETNGHFTLTGGAGNDVLKGGAAGDTINLTKGGEDSFTGGAGNDTITMDATLDAGDHIDGGAGSNTLHLHGDYSAGLTLGATTIQNIQTILFDNQSYNITANAANFASTAIVNIDGSALSGPQSLRFDGSASAAHFHFTGGNGNDTFIGGAGPDTFELQAGGDDTAIGGDGGDHFDLGAAFHATDVIDGGTGADRVEMTGGGPITFNATTMTNVETLIVDPGFNYSITTDDATVAAGQNLLVNANTLGVGDTLVFKGSAETDGSFTIRGGAGNDTVIGGAGADTFNMIVGGDDVVKAGGGSDTITMGAALTAADQINGAGGADAMTLSGDYSAGLTFGATTVVSVENIGLGAGFSYNLTSDDATVAAGALMVVDASALAASNTLIFNGAAETDGKLWLIGGAGNDTLTGGAQGDTFDVSHGGSDNVQGGAGNDYITAGTALDAGDLIDGGTGNDTLATSATGTFTLSSTNLKHIEAVDLLSGGAQAKISGDLTGANTALSIDASTTTTGVSVDVTAAPAGRYNFTGGAGDDTLTVSSISSQIINGGAGSNTLVESNLSFAVLSATTITNIDKIVVTNLTSPPATTTIVTSDITSGGGVLTIDTTGLTSFKSSSTDISQTTIAQVNFTGGVASDQLIVGAGQIHNGQINGTVDLGAGGPFVFNYLNINGPLAGPVTISDTNIHHVDVLNLNETSNSSWTVAGDISSGDGLLQIDVGQSGGTSAHVDLTAMTTPAFDFTGSNGDDTVVIGSEIETVSRFGGGNGTDTLDIVGGLSNYTFAAQVDFGPTGFSGLETLAFADGADYTGLAITGNLGADANNRTNHALTIDASALTGTHHIAIDLSQASGSINFKGGAGDDTVILGDNASTIASFDGGAGNNTIELTGGTGGNTLANVSNVNTVSFADGASYSNLTLDGSFNSTGAVTIDASALTGSNSINIDVSGVTAPTINFTGGAGDDTITFSQDAGNVGTVDGGAGNNTVNFHDASTATLSATTVSHIDTVTFTDGFSYGLTVQGDITTGTGTLTIDASTLSDPSESVTVDASAATSPIAFTGGAGDDTITLGANAPLDSVNGGGGTNTVVLAANPSDGVSGDDTISATNFQNIDNITLTGGAYEFAITGDISSTHHAFTVDATALPAIDQGVSAAVTISNTVDAVTYQGGAGSDLVAYSADAAGSAGATIDTNGGDDEIALTDVNSAAFISVDGGAGNNTVFLQDTNGDTSLVTLDAANYTNIQKVEVNGTQPLAITGDITGGSGALNVREDTGGSVDLSGATTAALSFQGSTGSDTLILGANVANITNATGNNTSGTPADTIELVGGVSNFTFSSSHFSQFTNIVLEDGASYTGDAIIGNISAHNKLTIDASALTGSNAASFDLSGANISSISFTGGAGDDSITLANFAASSAKINGGAGTDTIHSAGSFSLNSNASNIERVVYTNSGSTGAVSISGDITSGGGLLTIDASGVSAAVTTNFITLAGATTAAFNVTGSAGNDLISLNTFNAADMIVGGGGANEIVLAFNQAGFAITAANFTNVSEIDIKGTADVSGFSVVGDLTQGTSTAGTFTLFADQQSGKLGIDLSGVTTTNILFDGATGADTVTFGTGNFANARLTGEGGNDTAIIQGNGTDYTYAGTIGIQKLAQIDNLDLAGANNFTLSFGAGLASTLHSFTVDASGITGGKHAALDFTGVDSNSTITVISSAGDDVINFGNELAQLSNVNGGAGNDTLEIAGVKPVLNASNVSSVETVALLNTTSNLTTGVSVIGDITSGGGVLHFDTTAMSAGHLANVFAGVATTAVIDYTGGATNDALTYGTFNAADQFVGGGGSNEVLFSVGQAGFAMSSANFSNVNTIALGSGITGMSVVGDLTQGTSTAGELAVLASGGTGVSIDFTATTTTTVDFTGNDGNDTVIFSADKHNWGHVNGGKGNNTFEIKDSQATLLNADSVTHFSTLSFADGWSYSHIALIGDITSGGGTLNVDASALTGSNALSIALSGASTAVIDFTGGAGNDTVIFGANLGNAGSVDGGAGTNTLELDGSGSGTVNFNGAHFSHFSTLALVDGSNYHIAATSGFAGSDTLAIDASALSSSSGATVDVSALTSGTTVNFTGGAGDDTIIFGANLGDAGTVDGGAGNNTLALTGAGTDVTTSFNGASFTNFSALGLEDGNNYDITVTNGFTGSDTLAINASALSSGYGATIDVSQLGSTAVNFAGGAGNDTLSFGTNFSTNDTFTGGGGSDTLSLGANTTDVSDSAITGVSAITVGAASDFAVIGDITSGGGTLTIDASAAATFNEIDLSQATTSVINVTGGAGDDYVVYNTFNAANQFTGGDGYNEIAFVEGQAGFAITSTNFSAVDEIDFAGSQDETGFSITGDVTAGGDNAGDLDIYARNLTGKLQIDLTGVTTGEVDVDAGSGDDTITLSTANFNNAFLFGHGGNDTVIIQGDGTDFVSHTIKGQNEQDIANIVLTGDNNFTLTFGNALAASTNTLTVDASALTTGHSATLDFSGANTPTINATGGAGDDTMVFNASSPNWGTVDGGAGDNTLELKKGGGTTVSESHTKDFNVLAFVDGASYSGVTVTGDITGNDGTLKVDAGALTGSNSVSVDLTGVTSSTIDFTGGAGDDTVIFSSDNNNWGTVNGGGGTNTFEFNDGAATIVDGASVTNFSTLSFADGHDYVRIHVTGDITGNNGTLTVDSSAVSGGHSVDVDLSGVTSSGIVFTGGSDDDTVVFGANLANVVSADGGAGNNTLELSGGGHDVTTTFSGANLTNFSDLALEDGNNYDLTITGGFGGEAGLNIDASALTSTHGATIDVSGLTSFSVDFTGGAGNDTILAGGDLANMTIDGGGGNDVLVLDGDYSAGVPLSSISNIGEIDLSGHSNYVLTTADATVAAGATLTVDASALGPNFGLTFDGSAETDGYFNIKGAGGNDSLTLQTFEIDNSTIDGGGGFNTVTLTGNHAGDETFNATSFTHIDNIDYAVGSLGEELAFTGDITGDGSTLTVDETNADGIGGSGPDGDMLITDISALTDTIDLTGAVVDDYVVISSVNWTSLNGNGGNYNALVDTSTGPITFDAATITGFNTLVFNFDLNGNAVDFSGIGVVGDLTGNGGTLTIDARFSDSLSIDLSQATSGIAFDGSTGDDTIAFGNGFTSSDTVAGGGGNDTLSLGRNNATLADTAVTGVSTVTLSGGSAFAVTGDISANGTLTVDASALSDPHDVANINFSQATTGVINFTSGAGGDRVTFSASEDNWGKIDGGTGDNNFILNSGGTASIDGASVTDFSTIVLRDGGSYTLTLLGDIQGGGGTLTVGAGALSGGNSATVDASASTDKISFTGGAGDDTFTGSSHGDTISLGFGGIDTVHGGAGDDTINIHASTAGGDSIDGGAGANVLSISGVGEADLNGANITNIQTLDLLSNDVVITGDITNGQTLTINATAVSGVTIDLTQATTSSITINGTTGSDTLLVTTDSVTYVTAYNGGGGSDTLALSDVNDSGDWNVDASIFHGLSNIVQDNAGAVTISGDVTGNGGTLTVDASGLGSSDLTDVDFSAATSLVNITGGLDGDTFTAGNTLVAGDAINGGGGDDQVALSGDYQDLTLAATTLTNIAMLSLERGNFDITTDDGTVAAGQVLTVNAQFLGVGNTLTFNGSAETDGSFDFQVAGTAISAGEVTLTGGAGDDTLDIHSSSSTVTLDATNFQSIDTVDFNSGTLTVAGNITSSPIGTLTIDASGGNHLATTVDMGQVTTPTIDFIGSAANDTLIFGSNLGNVGTADGGGGTNTLELTGNGTDVAAGFSGANFTNFVPTLTMADGNNYHVYVQSGFAGNDVLTVDASQLSASYGAIVDVSRAAVSDVDFTGGAGNDTIVFGNGFSQVGNVDGGGGTNTIGIAGSTSNAPIAANFDGSEFANFSGLQLEEGDYYDITVVNGFTGNDVLNIDAAQLTTGYRTNIDVSQVALTVNFAGGTADDTLIFGANIGNAGTVDGGGGTNKLELTGGGSDVTTDFAGANFTNFHALELENGNNYDVTATSGLGGGGLSVDASHLSGSFGVTLDVSQAAASPSALINFTGGAGDDTIIFGANLADAGTINGGAGNNTLAVAGNGSDVTATFDGSNFNNFSALALENGNNYDLTVTNGFAGSDTLSISAASLSASYGATVDVSATAVQTVNFTGGGGDDTIIFGQNFDAAGSVDGGGGNNTLGLSGPSGGLFSGTLDASNFTNFTTLALEDGSSYDITLTQGFAGVGAFTVDASQLSQAYTASVDVSQLAKTVDFIGGEGNDTIIVSGDFSADDAIDGGAHDALDQNILELTGGTTNTVTFTGYTGDDSVTPQISNIEKVVLDDGASYKLIIDGALAKTQGSFHLDASALTGSNALTIDATQTGAGATYITGGAGDDVITIPTGPGLIDGGAGNDTVILASGGTLDASDFTSVENFSFTGDASSGYTVDVIGDLTGNGSSGTLSLDFHNVHNGGVTVDLTSATTGNFTIAGSGGDDTVIITAGENLTGYVQWGGFDTLELSGGSTSITLDHATLGEGFCFLTFADGASYSGVTLIGDIANNTAAFTVDASALTGTNSVAVDLSQETTIQIFATGGAGDDTFTFSASSFGVLASLDGGAGNNTLGLNNHGTDLGVTIGDSVVHNIETIALADGNNYTLGVVGDITSGGGTLTIDGSALTSAYGATIDLSSATTASGVDVTGGAGNDTITTGGASGNTDLDLSQGGEDTVHGGSASDFIYMGDALDTGDRIDGGGGFNTVYLEGDSYAGGFNLSGGALTNVNYVQMFGNHTYVLTGDPAVMNSSHFLTIDGGAMTGGSLQFDGSDVTGGTFSLYGGAGNDILKGGSGVDTLDLSVGGEDQLAGNGGNDIINAGGGLDAGDRVDGGAGTNTLNFNGDYSAGLVLDATTVTNVETFNFATGHSYDITTNDATVDAGQTLTVSASALGSGNTLTFNGSAETDGIFSITGGAGNDVVTGGAQADSITMGTGGNDTVHGGDGNDSIFMMTQWTSADVIDGGAGSDFVGWGGKDYTGASALVLSATSLNSVEEVQCNSGHAYSLTMNDGNVAAGATLLIDSTRSTKFTFDGSAETDGHFQIAGGLGADTLTGGQLSDTFMFSAVSGSTSTGYDTITNMNFSSDLVWLDSGTAFMTDYKPTGIDAAITTGALSTATFNTDLAAAVNSSTLAAHHAVLFTADSGTLSGHTFLVVDHNGVAGYQASSDYVIDVTGYTGTLATGSFT